MWSEFTKRGLRANGTTSFDRTNYFASFAANDENLKWYLDWQADAMVNSFIARKDLDSEMTVVRNEMESGENDPQRILWQRGLATLFHWHNYGKPTIGARSDVENVDIGRLQAFYRLYYQPDNATLIVSGRFDTAKVLGWVQASFGKIAKPKRSLPRCTRSSRCRTASAATRCAAWAACHCCSRAITCRRPRIADYPAIEALALILGDEPSGRLHANWCKRRRLHRYGVGGGTSPTRAS